MNKLINRNTGEIVVYGEGIVYLKSLGCKNVAEMIEAGWEEYKEPKQSALRVMILTLANFIENEPTDNVDLEDCKQMLKKLKAWERLKDTITCIDRASVDDVGTATLFIRYKGKDHKKVQKDLDLFFGGE